LQNYPIDITGEVLAVTESERFLVGGGKVVIVDAGLVVVQDGGVIVVAAVKFVADGDGQFVVVSGEQRRRRGGVGLEHGLVVASREVGEDGGEVEAEAEGEEHG
jgi:hypothetical protein